MGDLVGRDEELRRLAGLAEAGVAFVHGPGGVGKTALLLQHARRCREARTPCAYVNLRSLAAGAPSDAFLRALAEAMKKPDHHALAAELGERSRPLVLLVDTYEAAPALDAWLRGGLLPGLSPRVAVVIAGREPPSPEWRIDARWSGRFQEIALDNLSREDSARVLEEMRVPASEREAIVRFTRGHPLALVLCGQLFAARRGVRFEPGADPDVVRTLLHSFIDRVPGPLHRKAVEAAAVVRTLGEPLLASLLGEADVQEKFDWLRRLSFMVAGRHGLFPHDLVRDVLVADLRWRNPEWHETLIERAHLHYVQRSRVGGIGEQIRWVGDMVFLYRHNPAFVRSFGVGGGGGLSVDAAREDDVPELLAMVRRHEGDEAAAIAARWFRRQLHHARVVREPSGGAIGFRAFLDLTRARPVDVRSDPAAHAAWRHVSRRLPVRPGQTVTLSRFVMTRDDYQDQSPAQQVLGHAAMHHFLTTPRLAVACLYTSRPEAWAATYALLGIARAPEGDVEIGGRRLALSVLDLRAESPAAWSRRIAAHFVALVPPGEGPPAPPSNHVLGHAEFAAELRLALAALGKPARLAKLRILGARLINDRVPPGAGGAARIEALRERVREAAESLRATPQGQKHYLAFRHTYLEPAGSQEEVAEELDLPFSTYRRHLGQAVDDVIEHLWQREVGSL